MPDWIGDWLTKPKGWPFGLAVAASGFLLLWRFDFPPFNRAADEWLMAAGLVAMFGWTVTIVAIVAWAVPKIAAGLSSAWSRAGAWQRQRSPLQQLARLTMDEKAALCWLLVKDAGVDTMMVSPFKALVEAGLLTPLAPPKPHRRRPMKLSPQAERQRDELLAALGVSNRDRQELRAALVPPWIKKDGWMG